MPDIWRLSIKGTAAVLRRDGILDASESIFALRSDLPQSFPDLVLQLGEIAGRSDPRYD